MTHSTRLRRVYVHSDIYDDFVKASTELAAKKVVGDPFDEQTEQGPQVDGDQMKSILNYIKLGKEQGARLNTGALAHTLTNLAPLSLRPDDVGGCHAR